MYKNISPIYRARTRKKTTNQTGDNLSFSGKRSLLETETNNRHMKIAMLKPKMIERGSVGAPTEGRIRHRNPTNQK